MFDVANPGHAEIAARLLLRIPPELVEVNAASTAVKLGDCLFLRRRNILLWRIDLVDVERGAKKQILAVKWGLPTKPQ